MTPAGTSNEFDVENEREENTHTSTVEFLSFHSQCPAIGRVCARPIHPPYKELRVNSAPFLKLYC